MQNGKSNNFSKKREVVALSNEIEQEEKTLRILSEIICNLIINEISKDEPINDDPT